MGPIPLPLFGLNRTGLRESSLFSTHHYLMIWQRWRDGLEVTNHIQGHPMDLLLIISALHANFCWLGHLGKMIRPWKESVAGKETVQGVEGNLLSGVPAMWYLFAV